MLARRMPRRARHFVFVLSLLAAKVSAIKNGESITPQMGWNTWNSHKCQIDEKIILTAAKQLKGSGLADKGYDIVWIDDCWQSKTREAGTGRVLPDPAKFPSGFKNLTDQLHGMKLRAGIYSSAGTKTCGGFPGSLGHEDVDAKFYADMGFDALKYDNCFHEGQSGTPEKSSARFAKMSDAVLATKRKMVLALCNWGQDEPWKWADAKWNSWRITGDIGNIFGDDLPNCIDQPPPTADNGGYDCSVRKIIDKVAKIANLGHSEGWNDMDMLEIGNGNMSLPQEKTHFAMWALAKSPLILGNDMATLSRQTLAIVGNKDIIDISQDALHEPATRVAKLFNHSSGLDVWSGKLSGGAYVVAFTSYALKAVGGPIVQKDQGVQLGPGNMYIKMEDYKVDITFKDIIQDADKIKSFDIYDLWSGVNWDDPTKSVSAKKMEGSPFKNAKFTVQTHLHDTQVYKIVPNNA